MRKKHETKHRRKRMFKNQRPYFVFKKKKRPQNFLNLFGQKNRYRDEEKKGKEEVRKKKDQDQKGEKKNVSKQKRDTQETAMEKNR